MTLPLLVFESNDLSTFDTVEAACGYLEATDVRNGEFGSFDSDGYPVELLTSGYAVVGVRRVEGADPAPDELAARLRAYLAGFDDLGGTAAQRSELEWLIDVAARQSR